MSKNKKKKSVIGKQVSSKYKKKPYVRQWSETKVAYLTVGRWQPPHRGHEVLIKKTLDLAIKNNGKAFVYIYSYEPDYSQNHWLKDKSFKEIIEFVREQKNKNPLISSDRLYYMQKMFPEFETIYGDDGSLTRVPQYHRDYFEFLFTTGENISRIHDKRGLSIRTHQRHGNQSQAVIEHLKRVGFEKIILVVGSDRVESFRENNPGIEIIQAGDNRGSTGQGKLSDSDVSLINISDDIDLNSLIDYQPSGPIEFSGTKMRHYVKTGNTRKFVEGCAIGNMTYRDCLDMMDDVREGLRLNLLSKFNRKKTKKYSKVNPDEHAPGVITHMSQAHLDSQTKQDASGFIIQGGKRRKKIKKRKTKRKRTRKRRNRKKKRTRRKKRR